MNQRNGNSQFIGSSIGAGYLMAKRMRFCGDWATCTIKCTTLAHEPNYIRVELLFDYFVDKGF